VSTTNRHGAAGSLLFNPHTYDPSHFDDETRRLLRATIDWFEHRGKERLLEDYRDCVWYADFLEFVAKERLFAKMGTPAREANGDRGKRWDTSRISAFSEILAFYGLDYWYAWQVTILGLGPIWQSENATARSRAAQWLDNGAVFAFGLSEREHVADIYTTDMLLTPAGEGGFEPRAASTTSVTAMWPAWGRCSADGRTWGVRMGTCSSLRTASTRTTSWSRTSSRRRCTSPSSGWTTIRCARRTCCTSRQPGGRRSRGPPGIAAWLRTGPRRRDPRASR
jgi:hypothetical protein